MKQLVTEIEINAPASRVWEILTNFEKYPDWNPFILQIQGAMVNNSRLRVLMQMPGKKTMVFKPKVIHVIAKKEFSWLGRILLPGIFDGEHIFSIEQLNENKVRFVQRENFSGLLIPLMWNKLKRDVGSGFNAMNRALKVRAEAE